MLFRTSLQPPTSSSKSWAERDLHMLPLEDIKLPQRSRRCKRRPGSFMCPKEDYREPSPFQASSGPDKTRNRSSLRVAQSHGLRAKARQDFLGHIFGLPRSAYIGQKHLVSMSSAFVGRDGVLFLRQGRQSGAVNGINEPKGRSRGRISGRRGGISRIWGKDGTKRAPRSRSAVST